jgi:hypothetical protein
MVAGDAANAKEVAHSATENPERGFTNSRFIFPPTMIPSEGRAVLNRLVLRLFVGCLSSPFGAQRRRP